MATNITTGAMETESDKSKERNRKEKTSFSAIPVEPTRSDPTIVIIEATKKNGFKDQMKFQIGDDPDACAAAFISKNSLPPKLLK